jgi:hypothetical protein
VVDGGFVALNFTHVHARGVRLPPCGAVQCPPLASVLTPPLMFVCLRLPQLHRVRPDIQVRVGGAAPAGLGAGTLPSHPHRTAPRWLASCTAVCVWGGVPRWARPHEVAPPGHGVGIWLESPICRV